MTYVAGMTEELLVLARDPNAWAALATLIVMEIVLGIDNLIFISILTNKLPEERRSRARRICAPSTIRCSTAPMRAAAPASATFRSRATSA